MLANQTSNQIAVDRALELPFGDDQSEPGMLCFIRRPQAVM